MSISFILDQFSFFLYIVLIKRANELEPYYHLPVMLKINVQIKVNVTILTFFFVNNGNTNI